VRRDGEDAIVYSDAARENEITRFHFLRQQRKMGNGLPNLSLADYLSPDGDYLGGFAVTAGIGLDDIVAAYEKDHDDYHSILAKALADRLAESFAETLHMQLRKTYWGYAPQENLSNHELIRENYRGIRPAPGYPACPDHTEKNTLFRLLDAEAKLGMQLTESMAMLPTASVSGWYFAHPKAKYFGVGRVSRDQVEDMARRKGRAVAEAAAGHDLGLTAYPRLSTLI
jgi:5-methyltetrahydrofolate--homocysteine methyltransferase